MAKLGRPSFKDWRPLRDSRMDNPDLLVVQKDSVEIAPVSFTECALWDQIWTSLGGVNVPSVVAPTDTAASDDSAVEGARAPRHEISPFFGGQGSSGPISPYPRGYI